MFSFNHFKGNSVVRSCCWLVVVVVVHGLRLIRMSFFQALLPLPSSEEKKRHSARAAALWLCSSAALWFIIQQARSHPAIPQQRREPVRKESRAEDRERRPACVCKWNLDKYKRVFAWYKSCGHVHVHTHCPLLSTCCKGLHLLMTP